MTDALLTGVNLLAGLLAQEEPRQTGPDFGKAGPFGLIVVVSLLVGTFALVWSMNRHLKRLPESFDREHPEPDQEVDEGTVSAGGDAGAEATSDNGSTPGSAPREPGG
ncbi:MAG: hypothetical protein JST91_01485 [Actinobacteria bacterium]|nr:hypothetical protein [Actinomycetota bacterium]